jgi:hypothetical protein
LFQFELKCNGSFAGFKDAGFSGEVSLGFNSRGIAVAVIVFNVFKLAVFAGCYLISIPVWLLSAVAV